MSRLRKLLILPPLLVGVGLVYLQLSGREGPARQPPEERRQPVWFVELKPRAFTPYVRGYGEARPARTWEAVAQVSGRIAEIHPDFVPGGSVKSGDVLVRIEPEEYELAVAQAEANIESAAAQIEEMKLSIATTEKSLKIERESLDLARRQLERQRRLLARGAVPESAVEAQEAALLAQQSRVQNLENTLALAPAELKALEQARAVQEAALRIAKLNLERTVIRAPFDARVAGSEVEISQFVAAGKPMGALDGVDAAEINMQAPPDRMAALARLSFSGGMKPLDSSARPPDALTAVVRARFARFEASWKADVARISDTVDPATRSVGVIVSVPDPYGQARAGEKPPLIKGMFVEVELRGPRVEGLHVLPRSAIRDGRVMLVGPDDRLTFAELPDYLVFDDLAVAPGDALPAGERLVTSEPAPAIEGMRLAPRRDAETEARLEAAGRPE